MPRPVIHHEERAALTIRLSPDLKSEMEDVARNKGITLNDLIVEVLESEAKGADVHRTVRSITDAAAAMATTAMKQLERKAGQRISHEEGIVAAEAMLQLAIGETVKRMVLPDADMVQVGVLWEMILVDANKLGLKGPVWDYVRTLGPNSPPPTPEHRQALADEISKLKKARGSRERIEAIETLNVWLGLAADQHEEAWLEILKRREVQRDRARAALVSLFTDRSTKGSRK